MGRAYELLFGFSGVAPLYVISLGNFTHIVMREILTPVYLSTLVQFIFTDKNAGLIIHSYITTVQLVFT